MIRRAQSPAIRPGSRLPQRPNPEHNMATGSSGDSPSMFTLPVVAIPINCSSVAHPWQDLQKPFSARKAEMRRATRRKANRRRIEGDGLCLVCLEADNLFAFYPRSWQVPSSPWARKKEEKEPEPAAHTCGVILGGRRRRWRRPTTLRPLCHEAIGVFSDAALSSMCPGL